jgi:hypothetical protein
MPPLRPDEAGRQSSRFHVTLTFEVEVEATTAEKAARFAALKVRRGGKSKVIRFAAVKLP